MNDFPLKVLMVGDASVGKTSILDAFMHERFDPRYQTTIGIDYNVKFMELQDKTIKLQFWDTAGQERFRCITRSYYHDAQIIILVFSLAHKESFNNIQSWYNEILQHTQNATIVLVGNKSDLTPSITPTTIHQEWHYLPYFSVSAKTKDGIHYAMKQIVSSYVDTHPDFFTIKESLQLENDTEKKRGCFCF